MISRLSLRARLVLGVIVLAAAGLAVAGVATYASLRSFLFDRTDQTLADSSVGIARGLFEGHCDSGGRPLPGAAPGDVVQLRTADGSVVCTLQVTRFSEAPASPPELPADLPSAGLGEQAEYLTVPAVNGGGRYRVRVSEA
ncbi:MAG TPA: hypothetical protein VFR43_11775, partial [Gaiellaceae bacterium]|nr:hypothetical protein [Gaiellaceae bacterium]